MLCLGASGACCCESVALFTASSAFATVGLTLSSAALDVVPPHLQPHKLVVPGN